MDLSKYLDDTENLNTSDKLPLLQHSPPPYQEHSENPHAGDTAPGSFPSPSNYPGQQGPPGGQLHLQTPPYTQGPHLVQPAVSVQPAVFVTPIPLANPVPDYMCYSIFVMLCCCFPLGIAALIYSNSTQNANLSGHQQLAEKNSKMARNLNHVGLGIGLTALLVYIVLMIYVTIYANQQKSP